MLFSIESTDKFDSNTIALDCSDEEFRPIEASLCQVMHRTTANEPLRIVQQTEGQKGFKARSAIVRRYDQRNMSNNNSANAALIINVSERDRANAAEQLDDRLRIYSSTKQTNWRTDSARSEMRKRCLQSRN